MVSLCHKFALIFEYSLYMLLYIVHRPAIVCLMNGRARHGICIELQNFHEFFCRKLSRKLSGNFPEILEVLTILLIDTFSSCNLLTSI